MNTKDKDDRDQHNREVAQLADFNYGHLDGAAVRGEAVAVCPYCGGENGVHDSAYPHPRKNYGAADALDSQSVPHQITLDAITGAIAYGRQGTNPPPSPDHWLAEYWQIGQQLAELGKTSSWDNVTPIEPAAALDSQPTDRPTDDALWDATLRQRDYYHDQADDLAAAIASYLGADIGEHSSGNCPWANAIEALDEADPYERDGAPVAPIAPDGLMDRIAELEQQLKACADGAIGWAHTAGFEAGRYERLRSTVDTALEGWNMDAGLRKMLETALHSAPQQEGSEAGNG